MRLLAVVAAALAAPVAALAQSTQQVQSGITEAQQRTAATTGVPLWVWIVVALVVLALIVFAIAARRRRSQAVIKTRLG